MKLTSSLERNGTLGKGFRCARAITHTAHVHRHLGVSLYRSGSVTVLCEGQPDFVVFPNECVRHANGPRVFCCPHQNALHGMRHHFVHLVIVKRINRDNFVICCFRHNRQSCLFSKPLLYRIAESRTMGNRSTLSRNFLEHALHLLNHIIEKSRVECSHSGRMDMPHWDDAIRLPHHIQRAISNFIG